MCTYYLDLWDGFNAQNRRMYHSKDKFDTVMRNPYSITI